MHAIVPSILKLVHSYRHDGREMSLYIARVSCSPRQIYLSATSQEIFQKVLEVGLRGEMLQTHRHELPAKVTTGV